MLENGENKVIDMGRREGLELMNRLYTEAVALNYWLYDTKTKIWLSPPEFKNIYSRYLSPAESIRNFVVKDPIEGLDAAYKQIENLKERLEEFNRRVIEYYKSGGSFRK